jgi:ribosomal protein S18 acetylase RimI-like enzyme
MNLTIRPLSHADIEPLKELAVSAWEPVFASFQQVLGAKIYSLLYPDWRQGQRDAVAQVCADTERFTSLVAVVDNSIVGFIAYTIDTAEQSGEVELLAVHPDYQNHGIGTRLNSYALDEMKARGVCLAVVATGGDSGHAPARRSYEKAGYTGLPLVRYYKAL